jgi:hypothetical protein
MIVNMIANHLLSEDVDDIVPERTVCVTVTVGELLVAVGALVGDGLLFSSQIYSVEGPNPVSDLGTVPQAPLKLARAYSGLILIQIKVYLSLTMRRSVLVLVLILVLPNSLLFSKARLAVDNTHG